MKNILILTMVLIMNIGISAQSKIAKQPKINEPEMCEKILKAIAIKESGNRDLKLHKDGVSWGRYGITRMAVRELQRLDKLDCHFREKDLVDPVTNKIVAEKYLRLMFNKYKCWYKAAGAYHSQNPRLRDEYSYEIFKIILNDITSTESTK